MKLSIITPSFNHGKFIEDTIRSVLNQKGCEIEHIVIDGGSKDETVQVLQKYQHLIWVSEKDRGQSHAINKGFSKATGEVLAWINSDDYYSENSLKAVVDYFERNPNCDFLYGNITYVDIDKQPLFTLTGPVMGRREILINPDVVRQPSSFWRRRVIEEIGILNEDLHLAMDLEFFVRISKKYEMHYLDADVSSFRYYAASKSNYFVSKQMQEIKKIFLEHAPESMGLYRSFWRGRIWQKAKSFIKRVIGKK